MAEAENDHAPVQTVLTPVPHITPPAKLNLEDNKADNWKVWKQMWNNYSIIAKLEQHGEEYKIALFLHCIGPDALKVYNAMVFTQDEDKNKLDTIIAKFDEYIIGETNETYERYLFNTRDQEPGEPVDSYVTALKTQAKNCNFCNCMHDSLIRDRIVLGIRDRPTRKRCFEHQKLTLNKCIDICKSAEAASVQLKSMGQKVEAEEVHEVDEVNYVKPKSNMPTRKQKQKAPPKTSKKKATPDAAMVKNCKFCGRTHVKRRDDCPAWGETCRDCGKENHFAGTRKCTKIRVHTVYDYEQINTVKESVYTVGEDSHIYVDMWINDKSKSRAKVSFQVDCGATVNVLPRKYVKYNTLLHTDKVLQMWNGTAIHPLGRCRVFMRNPRTQKKYDVEFVIVNEDLTPLLGKRASEKMGLITVNYDEFEQVATVKPSAPDIITQYSDVFNSDKVGTLPGKTRLEVDDTINPVSQPPARIPVSMKGDVKQELDRLVDQGVLAPIDEPTDWTSRMVVATKKSGSLRICLDPRPLNKALKRERYQLPVMDEILPDLAKAKVFSKVDLSAGYWHVVLEEESSKLTTFQTPFGRYRWTRLPFGLNVSSEIFQKKLHNSLHGLDGVLCIADDIIVYGQGDDKETAYKDHDEKLEKLLQRCREQGIRLNKEKSEIRTDEITFLGHRVTSEGLKVDPDKVEAILKMQKPRDVVEVQRFCGYVNYVSRFLPKLTDIMQPLRDLTRNDVEWSWTSTHDKAFNDVKKLVTEAPLLAYYNPEDELVIQCDASERGLGAALLQNGRPIAYTSRALTDPETRYAQIEKEMLAIVYSLEKFHQYTYGRHTLVNSDHKPLEAIMKKSLCSAPKRLQGMLLRVQQYDIEVIYRRGKDMHVADMLSRAYLPNKESKQVEFEKVNMIRFLPIGDERIEQIRRETEGDEVLQMLRQVILQGWPDDKDNISPQLMPYFHIRDEMSVQNGLVFKGERVVIPHSMRGQMKKAIHTSHIGIESCLRRARECLFWPGMNADIKQYISMCETCRKYEMSNQKETLMNHELPYMPWEKVGVDLFELDGKDYMVTVDYYSNYWEIDRLYDTKAKTVICKLKAHFARYGIPCEVISDNGSQFKSNEFNKFSETWDFEHVTTSPYNSQANGKAESAVKSAKNLLRKTSDAQEDQYLALLDFRNTPTQGLGSSPVQRLMNKRTRSLLPMTRRLLEPRTVNDDCARMQKRQQNQSKYFDRSAKDLKPLEEGDTVRMKPFIKGKKEWKKGVVVERLDERSYEIQTDDGTYRRNRVHLKCTNEPFEPKVEFDTQEAEMKIVENSTSTSQNVTPVEKQPSQGTPVKVPNSSPVMRTRAGRTVRPPLRLKDFVT